MSVASPVCGSGGNFSSPVGWQTVASILSSALPQNATDFNATAAAYNKTAQWVGADDYWLEQLTCVSQLVHKKPSAEVEQQAAKFKELITVTMRGWEGAFSQSPQELVNATKVASTAAVSILTNISTSAPEIAVLPALDVAMLGLTANIGMLGLWMSQGKEQDLCKVATQAEEALGEMVETVEELMIAVLGGSAEIIGWPGKVVLCAAEVEPFPKECGEPIPWPFYWVGDGYLGENVFFGQKEEAAQFQVEYKAAIEGVILGLEVASSSGVATLLKYVGWVYWARMEACFASF